MDLDRALTAVAQAWEGARIRYAAIGGVAMALLDVPRMTLDLDFLVRRDDLPEADRTLQALGYSRVFRSENVSQFAHPTWGRVDMLHAFRTYSLAMLDRAVPIGAAAGGSPVRVAQPEDIIGLKLQATRNDPDRKTRDDADIEALAARHTGRLDWGRILEYYALFGRETDGTALRARFGRC